MPSDDAAQFLAGTPDRRRLLARLARESAAPAALADELDLPRRSVQRHLGKFVDRGWAESSGGTYRLTVTGELVVEEHATYLDALDRIGAFDPLFRHLPDRTHAPDPRWLEDATLTAASPENPQAPVRQYIDSVRTFDTERIRMLSPVLSRLFHDAHAELAVAGVHTELVLSAATIRRARELNPAEFAVVVSVGVLDLYRHPEDLGFGLTVGDDRVLMGAYDDEGQLKACVESEHPEFVRWAGELFERYRDRSDAVTPSLSLPFDLRD
ncbi:Predicted transcriptional regulator, contains HTH domain [Halopelagius inordinatus]|uniref:Predicted transcriptional regulator, contains HTH domain n=1 Tax=Halopelagius inordinatus TaxID=553467 RepID=A0A1I2VQU2_9EURY|nr:transcriptional regulator FilR1 domain-containing protein [Halopelagius inordinatus]SFG91532.1 Predicted transcriptional regulator, contains HTH domain [Halopelagius inordinatus]